MTDEVAYRRTPTITSPAWLIAMVTACVLSGTVYVFVQWYKKDVIEDAFFVGLLIGASVFLSYGLVVIRDFLSEHGLGFFQFIARSEDPKAALAQHSKLFEQIFNVKRCVAIGLLYGAVIASSVFVFGLFEEKNQDTHEFFDGLEQGPRKHPIS